MGNLRNWYNLENQGRFNKKVDSVSQLKFVFIFEGKRTHTSQRNCIFHWSITTEEFIDAYFRLNGWHIETKNSEF